VAFDVVPRPVLRDIEEVNHALLTAARPVLDKLGRAIADTRYFAILTNAEGVVVDVGGPIDRSDRRADLISRIGVNLSEQSVGTSAIGAALAELQPVWLHRGEHFRSDNASFSCAGAPLFGPDGLCVGMLDLTGIDVVERPELKHLVSQSARSIENALTLDRCHSLLVRLNWPGRHLGDDADGLVCLDADGWVTGANQAAREMIIQLMPMPGTSGSRLHSTDVFALPFEMLFDAARQQAHHSQGPMEVPLWSGLRLHALALTPGQVVRRSAQAPVVAASEAKPLWDVETELIHKAVSAARGNVMQAARELGISRATVYRKLGKKPAGRS
jgi:transcriptional regulator of acetoin/glycerol metabolism